MYKNKKTGMVGIIITILLLIAIVFLSNLNMQKLSYVENSLSNLVMPIQNGLAYLKNKINGNDSFFTDISNLKEENEKLTTKNSELEKSLRELEIIKAENETLKEYMNLKEKYTEFTTTPAYVIERDISNYNAILIINVGTKDGIKENMTVIADEGLVGHVISVTDSTAKVQTIIDTSNVVSATISTSRDNLIVRGTLEEKTSLKGTNIEPDVTILQGDNIETSGLGGIYPKGIHVGTIKQVVNTNNIVDRYAFIETAVNFQKLESVLVITK